VKVLWSTLESLQAHGTARPASWERVRSLSPKFLQRLPPHHVDSDICLPLFMAFRAAPLRAALCATAAARRRSVPTNKQPTCFDLRDRSGRTFLSLRGPAPSPAGRQPAQSAKAASQGRQPRGPSRLGGSALHSEKESVARLRGYRALSDRICHPVIRCI